MASGQASASVASVGAAVNPMPGGSEQTARVQLTAVGLECERSGRILFSGLDFSLLPGEIVQIDGSNGTGKTSLLRILLGLTPATEGEVLWCGTPLQDAREEYFGDLIYVGHNPGVKADLTARENLRIAQALGRPNGAMSIEQALARLGIAEMIDRPVRALSAGQRRRIALARLLVARARVWALDEPLTALDAPGRRVVEELLYEHIDGGGMAILTTHTPLDLAGRSVIRIHLDP